MKRGDKFSENFEKTLDKLTILWYNTFVLERANKHAVVVEQADTKDLKSFGSDTIRVRFPSTAPEVRLTNRNRRLTVGQTTRYALVV